MFTGTTVRMIANKLKGMIIKEEGDGGIFRKAPHMTWDNFFSGDEIMDYLGKIGAIGFLLESPSTTSIMKRELLMQGTRRQGSSTQSQQSRRFLQVGRTLVTPGSKVPCRAPAL